MDGCSRDVGSKTVAAPGSGCYEPPAVSVPPKALILLLLFLAACAAARTRQLREQAPAYARLIVDLPRREVEGVTERWALWSREENAFLVHASDVERRRVRQTCGAIPIEAFVRGWKDLQAKGLLHPVEDYRLVPPPGAAPFMARIQLRYERAGREVIARRPLEQAQLDALLRVLRAWEAMLQLVPANDIPAELRVEIAMDGCGPRPPRSRPPGADAGGPPPPPPRY